MTRFLFWQGELSQILGEIKAFSQPLALEAIFSVWLQGGFVRDPRGCFRYRDNSKKHNVTNQLRKSNSAGSLRVCSFLKIPQASSSTSTEQGWKTSLIS